MTREPDDDYDEDEGPDYEFESLLDSLEDRDMVLSGWYAEGPYAVEVMENGEIGDWSTIVLPSRVGWEPTF
jgi:hypothetical protein